MCIRDRVLLLWMFICLGAGAAAVKMGCRGAGTAAGVLLMTHLAVFIWYYRMSVKQFGGVTAVSYTHLDVYKRQTHNIKMACSRRKGLRLLRCLREPGAGDSRPGVIHMPDVEAAVTWLSSVKGNILVTTGSKELAAYTRIRDYGQRIYARILPSAEAVAQCRSLGFEGRHIIAMQGPFSEEMNLAQLREYGCAYQVTKDGGAAGGFPEKMCIRDSSTL